MFGEALVQGNLASMSDMRQAEGFCDGGEALWQPPIRKRAAKWRRNGVTLDLPVKFGRRLPPALLVTVTSCQDNTVRPHLKQSIRNTVAAGAIIGPQLLLQSGPQGGIGTECHQRIARRYRNPRRPPKNTSQ